MKNDPTWLAKRAAYLTMGVTNAELDELVSVAERTNGASEADRIDDRPPATMDLLRLLVRVSDRLGAVYASSLLIDYSRFSSMRPVLAVARRIARNEIDFPEAAAFIEYVRTAMAPEIGRD